MGRYVCNKEMAFDKYINGDNISHTRRTSASSASRCDRPALPQAGNYLLGLQQGPPTPPLRSRATSVNGKVVSYNGLFEGATGGFSWRVISYTHLSDEKTQNAATTFENTVQMFEDIYRREELKDDQYWMVIQITFQVFCLPNSMMLIVADSQLERGEK
jgi:hypothetical protein